MGKANRKGRNNTHGKFVMLLDVMTRTPAWRDLKPADISVYLLIAQRYNGGNNGHIGLSVRDAARLAHIAPNTAKKAFERLQERGLIKCVKKGAFSVKTKQASEWELTVWAKTQGTPASHLYKNWTPAQKQNTVSNRDAHGIKSCAIIPLNRAVGS